MARKRKPEAEEEEFEVALLDGASDSEDSEGESGSESEGEHEDESEGESDEAQPESEPESKKQPEPASDDSDSEAELNALLAAEEPEEDGSGSEVSEPETITDQLSGMKIRGAEHKTQYADGSERILKPEIDPVYDSDDLDAGDFNTIGNIPLSAYEEMPHLGYDINGKRIMRPAKGSALDALLEQIDLPEGWTGLLDPTTGKLLNLSEEEIELIRKIQHNEATDENINPYEPTIEWFTSQTEQMPLSAAPEPKRRFMPSKHEAKRVMKIVRAIREGKILLPKKAKEQAEQAEKEFDLWEQEEPSADHAMNLKAPKLAPPTNEESYNPPEEYLFDEEEQKAWEEKDPAARRGKVMPVKYGLLRKVPGYSESVRERFERCLDLYLAPRVRHNKLNIDPELLVPELPSPKDLRPFPIRCSTVYSGHSGRVRTVSVDPTGVWLATGSDDGSVRVWEILSGRQVFKLQAVDVAENPEDKVDAVEWHPTLALLAVAAAENILLVVPPVFGFDLENDARTRIESGWGYDTFGNKRKNTEINVNEEETAASETPVNEAAKWVPPTTEQLGQGIAAVIECRKPVKKLSWHRKGDYFVSVAPELHNLAVLVHQLSKHLSQLPFRKNKGITMDAMFHPFKPQLFVASQRAIRIYDLAQQQLHKKLLPGARLLSGIDIHPRGDHLLASSYDKRVMWHDLDLGSTPYKSMRYHTKAVRSVGFHKGKLPLFASSSDDGSIHVFHGTVYDDYMTNPLLVPLKKLTGHSVVGSIGVLDLVWHPKEAWLFSAGADGTARLWTT